MDFDVDADPTLAIDPIEGIRVWGLLVRQGVPVLTPVASPLHDSYAPWMWAGRDDNPWLRPGWAKAECYAGYGKPGTWHLVPGSSVVKDLMKRFGAPELAIPCWCGIWAAKGTDNFTVRFILAADKQKILGIPTRPKYVAGRVKLAGAVLEHSDGYRAERARVSALYDLGRHSREIRMLGAWHEVPVLGPGDYLMETM